MPDVYIYSKFIFDILFLVTFPIAKSVSGSSRFVFNEIRGAEQASS